MDLAKGFAVNQIAFGLGMVAAPAVFGRGWAGGRAGDARSKVLIRSIGARNVALGAGTLLAHGQGGDARRWLQANALAEAGDVAVLLPAGRLAGAAMAAATAAVAAKAVTSGGGS